MKRITREWVQKAEGDHRAAGKLAPSLPPHPRKSSQVQDHPGRPLRFLKNLPDDSPRTRVLKAADVTFSFAVMPVSDGIQSQGKIKQPDFREDNCGCEHLTGERWQAITRAFSWGS